MILKSFTAQVYVCFMDNVMIYFQACHFDPLLDDSVMFAKKLSKLGNSVTLKVFDNLPHGFLSFSDASPEARQASMFCVERIKQVLNPHEKF